MNKIQHLQLSFSLVTRRQAALTRRGGFDAEMHVMIDRDRPSDKMLLLRGNRISRRLTFGAEKNATPKSILKRSKSMNALRFELPGPSSALAHEPRQQESIPGPSFTFNNEPQQEAMVNEPFDNEPFDNEPQQEASNVLAPVEQLQPQTIPPFAVKPPSTPFGIMSRRVYYSTPQAIKKVKQLEQSPSTSAASPNSSGILERCDYNTHSSERFSH